MAGKGDVPRPIDKDRYDYNFEVIFGSKHPRTTRATGYKTKNLVMLEDHTGHEKLLPLGSRIKILEAEEANPEDYDRYDKYIR